MGKQCSDLQAVLPEEMDARGLPCFHPLEPGSLATLLTEVAARVTHWRENHLSQSLCGDIRSKPGTRKSGGHHAAINAKVLADGSRVFLIVGVGCYWLRIKVIQICVLY